MPLLSHVNLKVVMVAELDFLSKTIVFLASSPSPEDIIAFKASKEESRLFEELVYKSKFGEFLSESEEKELESMFMADHIMAIAKVQAFKIQKARQNTPSTVE
ncbi:MAG: hypothetical protein AAF741_16115 [Bacteroidota bacterium]